MLKDLFSIFKDIFTNKKLLMQFSYNDFRSRYASSTLGIFWAFVNPIVTVLTYWFVFDVGLKNGIPPPSQRFFCSQGNENP